MIVPLRPRHLAGACAFLALGLAGPLAAQCNTAPTAVADSASTIDNRTLLIDVLANDSDPDGDLLLVNVVEEDCPGSVTVGEFEVLTFEPNQVSDPVFCVIRYRADDGTTLSAETDVTVEVTPFQPEIFVDGFESGGTSAWDDAQG